MQDVFELQVGGYTLSAQIWRTAFAKQMSSSAQPQQRFRIRSRSFAFGHYSRTESRTKGQRLPYRRTDLRGCAYTMAFCTSRVLTT